MRVIIVVNVRMSFVFRSSFVLLTIKNIKIQPKKGKVR